VPSAVAPASILSLISNASLVVQLVMLVLLLASFISWILIFERSSSLSIAKKNTLQFEQLFWSGADLTKVYREASSSKYDNCAMAKIFRAGFKEFSRLNQLQADALMNGVMRAMRVAIAREEEKLEQALPFLATVGSISPYVGLFGTVWGIMNSFRGLALSSQANLATVAPGIAEALIATAIGLFAAIPAVVAFNRFSAKSDWLLNRYYTFADEFAAILHRRVHS